MYEARQNINVYPRTISTVRNRYNRPPQAIQRHVFLNGKVIGIDRAQKEFERMKLELNIKQITFLKHLIESDKHYLFSELIDCWASIIENGNLPAHLNRFEKMTVRP